MQAVSDTIAQIVESTTHGDTNIAQFNVELTLLHKNAAKYASSF